MKLRFHFFVGLLARVGLFAQLSMLHAQSPATNLVLEFDGTNSYVELPPNIFNNLDAATVEAWVKWERLGGPGWNRVFNYGSAGHDLSIGIKDSDTLWFVFVDANHGFQEVKVPGVVKLNEWIHVAAVSGKAGMRVYVNGRLAGQNPNPGSFSALKTGELNRLGKTVTEKDADPPFKGQLDEVRIWKMARTEEEIRQGMSRMLTGGEPGLAGLWNFDDPANPGRDASPAGHHGKLMGKARLLPASYPGPVGIPSAEPEKVLTLAGNGNYLELPAELFQGLNVATLECRVKWHSFAGNEHVFEFDAAKRVKVGNRVGQPDLEFMAAAPPTDAPPNPQPPSTVPGRLANEVSPIEFEKNEAAATSAATSDSIVQAGALTLNRWQHLAVVFDTSGTQLYLDGTSVGSAPYTKGLAPGGAARHFMGSCSLYPYNSFHGQLREVRLWRVARTAEQIRQHKDRALTGAETGLAGLWNFDDAANPGRDASPNGKNAILVRPALGVTPQPISAFRAATPQQFPFVTTENVLSLDGNGSYVELPPNLFTNQVVTVEGWVKWREFGYMSRFFHFADAARHITVMNRDATNTLWFEQFARPPFNDLRTTSVPDVLSLGEWHHIAAVASTNGIRLYLNGSLVSTNETPSDWSPTTPPPLKNFLGRSVLRDAVDPKDADFSGEMAEVRLWAGERTAEQIQGDLFRRLVGTEPGLLAFWNFADGTARDASGNGRDGRLMGNARVVKEGSRIPGERLAPTNLVVTLDGTNSFVELPSNIFNDLTEATVEGWVKWRTLRKYSRFFDFGQVWRSLEVANLGTANSLYLSLGRPPFNEASELRLTVPNLIRTNEWCHIAAVTGPGGVRLYFNGILVASNDYTGSFAAINNGDHNYLGRSNWEGAPWLDDARRNKSARTCHAS